MPGFPPLPININDKSTGHFDHHDLLHTFFNSHANTLEGRLHDLEVFAASISKSPVPVTFSFPGPLPSSLISATVIPAPCNGTIDLVVLECQGALTVVQCDLTRNGVSVFTPGTSPYPQCTTGVHEATATPDPAKHTVVKLDGLSAHILSATGTPSDLTVTAFITPS